MVDQPREIWAGDPLNRLFHSINSTAQPPLPFSTPFFAPQLTADEVSEQVETRIVIYFGSGAVAVVVMGIAAEGGGSVFWETVVEEAAMAAVGNDGKFPSRACASWLCLSAISRAE